MDISEFLRYLASHKEAEVGLPALSELSRELGISVATLREQLEVARALGLVEVKPRTGMRRRPYEFASTVRHSLGYALILNDGHFQKYSELRNHIESAYWDWRPERTRNCSWNRPASTGLRRYPSRIQPGPAN